ncbi:MAG: Gfo/Idh/MocA family oxidoreductase, partial [Planctomycetales bacterium]|nr:Gfo/Idh/MocA family oxidoreductase [Planctomycetales bacterium]
MPKQYRAAVIGRSGHGDYGHHLDEAFDGFENIELVAVADDNKMGLAAMAKKHNLSKAYADYRQMLDETKPDIVAICARWIDQHRDMAVAAAERGIHIYMEKPFCRDLAEADEIIAACERTHAKLAIAHPTRYSPKVAAVKRLIEDGRFGKVLEYRGRGKEDRRGGGEDLWVLGTHVMDMIRTVGGHPLWCFANVTEGGELVGKEHVRDGAEGIGPLAGDALHATYGMPGGAMAYFSSVRDTAGNPTRFGLQIYCSHGIIEILEGTMGPTVCLRDRSWSPQRSGKEWQEITSAGFDTPEPLSEPRYFTRHGLAIEDLLSAIEGNREPQGGMYEARGATEMIA